MWINAKKINRKGSRLNLHVNNPQDVFFILWHFKDREVFNTAGGILPPVNTYAELLCISIPQHSSSSTSLSQVWKTEGREQLYWGNGINYGDFKHRKKIQKLENTSMKILRQVRQKIEAGFLWSSCFLRGKKTYADRKQNTSQNRSWFGKLGGRGN